MIHQQDLKNTER